MTDFNKISGHISVSRNLKNRPFKLNSEESLSIKSKLKKIFKSACFMSVGELPVDLVKSLIVNDFIEPDFTLNEDAFIIEVDSKSGIYIVVGGEDVVSIKSTVFNLDVYGAYDRLLDIEKRLLSVLEFAFSPQYGYLTVNPANSGTGLKIYLDLYLKNLTFDDKIDQLISLAKEYGFTLTTKRPDLSIYTLTNFVTVGVTENEILSSAKQFALNALTVEDDLND
ncbi:MAG: hypothetical protein J6B16_00875 [Clostridia bacterium]|nr:hypothetical protein [Clostridia bacterium]